MLPIKYNFDNVRNSKLAWVSQKIFLTNFLTGKRKFFFENFIVQRASVVHWDCFSASSHLVVTTIYSYFRNSKFIKFRVKYFDDINFAVRNRRSLLLIYSWHSVIECQHCTKSFRLYWANGSYWCCICFLLHNILPPELLSTEIIIRATASAEYIDYIVGLFDYGAPDDTTFEWARLHCFRMLLW